MDRVFAQWNGPGMPGCVAGAIQGGRFLHKNGYGEANLDYGIENRPDMVYYVGSISKQFTAAVIGLLSLRGKLSLDDDVRKFIPELPEYGAPLTIRHLLHHTSGLRDIYVLMTLRGDRMEDVFPDSAAIALIARQKGLAFPPGAEYAYNNTGYFLLAQIVRRVTGTSLREYADAEVFGKLGMRHTHFHDDPGHVMKRRAMSYERDGDEYRISYVQNFDKVGAGGLYTTLDDLRKWDENFYTGRVGGEALRRFMHARGVLSNGDTLPYAPGNVIGSYRGLRTVAHGGALMGYRAHLVRFPDQRFTAVVLCNLGAIDPAPLAYSVAEVFVGDKMGVRDVAAQSASEPGSGGAGGAANPFADVDVMAFAGAYYSEDLDVTYRVDRGGDGRLVLHIPRRQPLVLIPLEPNRFRGGPITLRFERPDVNAPATAVVIRAGRVGDMRLVRK